ncbi:MULTISPECIES: SsgA family sporulation/cell division regulator [unclassified Streptomyces]|uniref:SsgA family sporulation/cell division regulator n=1 Tax=unclassified Streptomyces TaxID=2593676 RepID=UPI002E805E70|nr:SsgA family sporulation/cell division regulator [Streptomyces sp. NBC_00562]WUC23149.1 SsgA family sporulation/cell division regulator [Streptomyces sp. NBC_00562]
MTQPLPSAAETSVTHEVVAHIVVADEPPMSLPAELRYDRADPYAVCLSIGTTSMGTVDWMFARSLLSEGMSGPVGVGDVLVVSRHDCHRHSVRIVIRSPAGAAVLDISASVVTAFLERARMVVPPGAEGLHIDLDRVVAELLPGSE